MADQAAEDDSKLAEEWAAMSGDGEPGGGETPRSSTRTRSTACSASATATIPAATARGFRAIIDSALVSYERLPMLEVVSTGLVRLMTTSLRNFTRTMSRFRSTTHLDPLGDYLTRSAAGDAQRLPRHEWDN